MPTPSIQTLVTDAQQILNLDSISAVRSVVAVALANANTGTPLNPNLTTQQLWNEFYQVVNKPKSDIESIIANQLMKFLFAPPAPGGVGANGQVIFNDNGVLAGDPQFLWNKTTNLLTVTGSATITGDLTVDTSTLKVDSANNRVGIGTATPNDVFQVSSNNPSVYITDNSIAGSDQANLYFGPNTVPTYAGILVDILNDNFNIRHNSSTRLSIGSTGIFTWQNVGGVAGTAMTLNSTGLGVGASPGLTGGSRRALTVNAPTGQLSILELAVNGSTTGYLYSNAAQTQLVAVGATYLAFETNSAERMRIDSSGNVGVGVTPSTLGSVYRSIEFSRGVSMFAQTDAASLELSCNAYINSSFLWTYKTTDLATHYRQYNGTHQWHNAPSGTAGNAITFTQAMTLDASGNLLVGKTALGTTDVGFQVESNGSVASTLSASTSATNTFICYSTGAAAYRFYVGLNGTINATNTTISAISDARFKENVQDIDVGLGAILALKPRKFDWKAGKGKDIKGDRGFIAQEFEQVFPQLVDEWADPAPEGEAPYKSVRQDLIPVLVKAIQELTARVQTLEAR